MAGTIVFSRAPAFSATATLLEETTRAGMDALVEVHTAGEAQRARALGAELVGVNNRDLTTFDVDLATAERLAEHLESIPVTVAESGVHAASDARRMADAGYHAVLVGEALVRANDPGRLLADLRAPT